MMFGSPEFPAFPDIPDFPEPARPAFPDIPDFPDTAFPAFPAFPDVRLMFGTHVQFPLILKITLLTIANVTNEDAVDQIPLHRDPRDLFCRLVIQIRAAQPFSRLHVGRDGSVGGDGIADPGNGKQLIRDAG